MKERFLKLKGGEISYFDEGEGPAVTLVHGLGGYKENWELNIPSLMERGRVLALDLPGHGNSEKPDVDYNIEFYAETIREFITTLGIARHSLIGNSMGGQLSLLFTLKYPELVDKLILVDAAGSNLGVDLGRLADNPVAQYLMGGGERLPEETIRAFIRMLFYQESEVAERMVRRAIEDMDQPDARLKGRAMFRSGLSVFSTNLSERLGEIKVPTLIIWGGQDHLLSVSNGEYFKQNIKNSRLEIFDRCGHVPMLEDPHKFNEVIKSFL